LGNVVSEKIEEVRDSSQRPSSKASSTAEENASLREAEAFLAEGVGPSAGEGLERRGSDVQGVGGYEKGLLWQSAIALHQNLYENWLPPEMVEKNVEDVKKFVNKLRRSTCRWTRAIAGPR